MDRNYAQIIVNDWSVIFRFRDQYNRIKVAEIVRQREESNVLNRPAILDDCNGDEFLKLLNVLNSSDDEELVQCRLIPFERS